MNNTSAILQSQALVMGRRNSISPTTPSLFRWWQPITTIRNINKNIEMKELEELAESLRGQLNLDYDTLSVKFIEEFIERQKGNFDIEQRKGLINSIGSFVGQCIIKNYGGHWQLDAGTKSVCIAFDDKNKIFPFAKTTKQFDNGLEDSVYSFYTIIPTVFKLSMVGDKTDIDNFNQTKSVNDTKKWWKFW